jgi:hypothetical protein
MTRGIYHFLDVGATRYGECTTGEGPTVESLGAPACQDYVKSQCDMITSVSPEVQAGAQQSCVRTNRPESLYHTNWSVLAKREGQTHEYSATSDRDIAAGRTVKVTGVAGNGLIVQDEPAAAAATGEER